MTRRGGTSSLATESSRTGFRAEPAELAVSHHPAIAPETLIAGFVPFRREQIEDFCAEVADAVPMPPPKPDRAFVSSGEWALLGSNQ